MAAALPNLAAPSPLGALLQPTLTDPMLVDGHVNLDAIKANLRAQIQEAAETNGEVLSESEN